MMEPKWFCMAVTVLFIGGWCATDGCLEEERVALLQLKSFFDDPYDYLRDWEDVKGSNCCEWNRVKCSISTTRVIELSLNKTRQWKRGRYGYLNASLFTPFTELKSLYLNWNKIASFVENGASALRKLEILDLSNNGLNESILSSLSGLSSLKSLYLSSNEFTGSNHTNGYQWLSRLGNLETLDLRLNNLKNNFLLHVGGLSSLKTLNLAFNRLGGSVNITELNIMKKLRNLDLSYNAIESFESFQGKLMMNLEELYLTNNQLQNSSFGFISGLSNLKTLHIDYDNLQGYIDIKELEGLKDLEALYLSYNFLAPKDDSLINDNILESIGVLTSLKILSLSRIRLTGPLPVKGWCDLWNLEELDLSGNGLEGEIPSCFHNLTSLRLLDISKNYFEIPSSFISFANNTNLKFLFIDKNSLVREPTFYTQTENPKFQLKVLSMSKCTIKGLPKELPNFLYHQNYLRYLDLSFNKFCEETPFWLLKNNTRIQQFLIAGNSFRGPLQLPKRANVDLVEVYMSGNQMQGQIPMNICSTFPHLSSLLLSHNAFEGDIPPCLGGLKSLFWLDLSYNNFSGGIVLRELAKSNSLRILRLSSNNLSGKIPPSILSSSTMYQLYLDGNNFDGEIPLIDISNVSRSLTDIDLSNNHLSGTLPRWIWNASSLVTLVLSNNYFDGHIPHELCNLGGLKFLDLSQNNFTGYVPSCFSSLIIEHLYLSRNKLSGPLPHALYNNSLLVTLDLSENRFTGKIPNWIRTLSALRVLNLKANHLEGEIPSQICQLKSLSIVDLSQNKLFGHTPSCLSNLTLDPTSDKSFGNGYILYDIKALSNDGRYSSQSYPISYVEDRVMFTTKKGLHTYSGSILEYMSGIDLSCNKLSGRIPPEIGDMSELHSLNLSHNSLTGIIPSTFSRLRQVESLDLSHNKLSGIIPIQLMELNSLAVFNVSYNNLSGNIPYEKAQFATFDENSYLGNPFLCGPPKNESCTETGSTPNAPGSEEESGLLDKQVFYVTFWVCYAIVLMTIGVVLYINPYWRRSWFYFIQQCIDMGYYFILDNVIGFSLFRRRRSS